MKSLVVRSALVSAPSQFPSPVSSAEENILAAGRTRQTYEWGLMILVMGLWACSGDTRLTVTSPCTGQDCKLPPLCASPQADGTCGCPPGTIDIFEDGTTCEDENECLQQNGGCDPNATCENRPGGRTCTCKSGFEGDGTLCTASCEQTLCSGQCVDTQTNTNHCGNCGQACKEGYACVGGVCVGSGNLRFTITWSREGDGDLWVRTPNQNVVYYYYKGPDKDTDGGILDVDDTDGLGPENIFWDTKSSPPQGIYHVCFEPFKFDPVPSPQNPVRYILRISRRGQVDKVIEGDVTNEIKTFRCNAESPNLVATVHLP